MGTLPRILSYVTATKWANFRDIAKNNCGSYLQKTIFLKLPGKMVLLKPTGM
jgi:hypothetical protein